MTFAAGRRGAWPASETVDEVREGVEDYDTRPAPGYPARPRGWPKSVNATLRAKDAVNMAFTDLGPDNVPGPERRVSSR